MDGNCRNLIVTIMAVAVLAAGCSSGGDSNAKARADRGGQKQRVNQDGELVFHVVLSNRTTKPIEVGMSTDVSKGAGVVGLSVAPPTDSSQPTVQFQQAGRDDALVIPAAADGTAQTVDLVVHPESALPSPSGSRPDPGMQELLLVMPTLQLRFQIKYEWAGEDNFNYLTQKVGVQTRFGNGYQWGYRGIQKCFDPTNLPKFASEIGNPDQAWNWKPGTAFDQVTVDFRAVSEMTQPCTGGASNEGWLPAMSLAPPGAAGETGGIVLSGNFVGAQMAGADLSSADLSHVDFDGANLAYARLDHANLTGANLNHANLTGASFDGTNLAGVTMFNTMMYDADLSKLANNLTTNQMRDSVLCGSKLAPSDVALYRQAYGVSPLERTCDRHLFSSGVMHWDVKTSDFSAVIATNSSVPLTLLQTSNLDCAMPSVAGPFTTLPFLEGCHATYGSSRIPKVGEPDDDAPRTTTTIAGTPAPADILGQGSIDIGPDQVGNANGGLAWMPASFRPDANYGPRSIVCLLRMRPTGGAGNCPVEYQPLPG